MFILYGFVDRDLEVKSGAFDCPNCAKRRYCKHRKIESWLWIFFIPVCPGKIHTEYWKCDDCRRSFEKPSLRPFLPAGGYLRSDMRADLKSGTPIEVVTELLVESGISEETAEGVIGEIVGKARHQCPVCGLTYLGGVMGCKKCGAQLAKGAKQKRW